MPAMLWVKEAVPLLPIERRLPPRFTDSTCRGHSWSKQALPWQERGSNRHSKQLWLGKSMREGPATASMAYWAPVGRFRGEKTTTTGLNSAGDAPS
ncbi:hypothetical protein V501_04185 [Pseudogymnoascus sp. VKM F-4519 (FW-2642)]|nr:hypothetical protein V501_04185 [Pseudogymnoascus sp. VKM F-4519 (FW-2642)]